MPGEGEKISEIDRKRMREDPTRAYWYIPEQREKRAKRREKGLKDETQKKAYSQWRKGKGTL